MNENIILLIDDVHLEHRNLDMQKSFAQSLNNKINAIKEANNTPILVCAGDINENDTGVHWLKNFDCDIVYVCGNHEFWNNDYYEVIDNIRKEIADSKLTNIHFLHNETIVLNGIRFIGGTLWTNFLEKWPWWNKNRIIEHYSLMADFKRISAKKFYESEKDVEELKQILTVNGVPENKIQDLIEKKLFNPLLQLREYNLTKDYILKELSTPFEGQSFVVTHHLPVEDLWSNHLNMSRNVFTADYINDDKVFKKFLEKKPSASQNILMMGFYVNNLKNDFFNKKFSPEVWVHGHFHQPVIGYFGKTLVISSPVGHFKDAIQQELRIKEINMSKNNNRMAKEFLTTSFKKINIEKKFVNIENLRLIIKNVYIMINAGLATNNEFETLIKNMHKDINNEIKNLSDTISQQLSSYIEHSQIAEEGKFNKDYFTVNRLSGLYDWIMNNDLVDITYLEDFQINDKSFGDNPKEPSHYIHWIKELDKTYNNLIQYQKNLIDFSSNL